MPHVVVGTAGHIDHGKTALIKAITGIDTDRLKEEKERGITIDIGFAHLELGPATSVSFIDVPGHERFIKNMLAGVAGLDLVMLVIAADESVMPQTREHLDICSLLRIKQGFTVLTKIDKVEPDMAALVEMEVREFLKGSFLEHSPILRVSSQTREGIPELINVLRQAVHNAGVKDDTDIFRLPVDRCFTMKGFGTVVTGTLVAGRVEKDQEVEVMPEKNRARVRGIQVHGRSTPDARAGQRTALNLQGIDMADLKRGMVLTEPGLFAPTSMVDCYLELLRSAPNRIDARKRVRFHSGTAELMGYVALLGRERLSPGESGFAQIRLEEPTFVMPGDRFIIRQYSPMITIGGGEILDALPSKHRRMDSSVIARLRVLKDGTTEDRILSVIQEAHAKTIELTRIAAARGMVPAKIHERLEALAKAGRVRFLSRHPVVVVSESAFRAMADEVVSFVRRFHDANPLVAGVAREQLKAQLFGESPEIMFESVIGALVADRRIALAQDIVYQFGRTITLKADEERARAQLADRFRALGLHATPAEELIDALKLDRNMARKILQLMIKQNELVKIAEGMLIDRKAIEKLMADVKALKATNPKLGVAEFKALTGVTRKYAIPLLEYLDRQRITIRVGDERRIL